MRVGLEAVLAEIEFNLLRNAWDRLAAFRYGLSDLCAAEGVVSPLGERGRHGHSIGACEVVDPDGAIRKSPVEVRRGRDGASGSKENVADITIAVPEDIDSV